MKYAETNVGMTPEILKRKLGGELFAPITVASGAFTNGVCKAGTPLGADGAVANTADAVGILLNDVTNDNPNGSLIKAFATINTAVAQAHSGVTYADAMKEALSNIVFE